jgi:hypothetical protein
MWPLNPRTILFNWKQGIDMPGAPLLVMFWVSFAEGAAGNSIRERPDEVWQTAGMRYDGATSHRYFRSLARSSSPPGIGGRAACQTTSSEPRRHSRQESPLRQRLPPSGFGNVEGVQLAGSAGRRGVHGQGGPRGRSVAAVPTRPKHLHDRGRRGQRRQGRRSAHHRPGVFSFDVGGETGAVCAAWMANHD